MHVSRVARAQALVSLLFSFMVIWDLPNLQRGVRALKTSRLGFAYKTISPQVLYPSSDNLLELSGWSCTE